MLFSLSETRDVLTRFLVKGLRFDSYTYIMTGGMCREGLFDDAEGLLRNGKELMFNPIHVLITFLFSDCCEYVMF